MASHFHHFPKWPPNRLAVSLLAILASCGGDSGTQPTPQPPPPSVSSVVVTPAAVELISFGETRQLNASARDANGNAIAGKTFSWSSGNPEVATVDGSSGLVTAVDNGDAVITARTDGISGTASITVANPVGAGPTGSTVSVVDGAVTLEFPPGAVSETVIITAEPTSDFPLSAEVIGGTVYEFGPDGTQFAEPVQLTITYDPLSVLGGIEESSLGVYKVEEDGWELVLESTVDTQAKTVSAPINSFSIFGVLGDTGFDCSTVSSIPATECEVLVRSYLSTDGENWTDNVGWLQSADPCGWTGIQCSGGHVASIDLSSNRLSGSVPSELGNLSNLDFLRLDVNQLSGSVPAELGSLSSLTSLILGSNQLTGTIPPELGNLPNLTSLVLSSNQLTGEIPSELGSLSSLISLSLHRNELTGTIPAELGNLSNLTRLGLTGNQLTGSIPAELGSLSRLTQLEMSGNQLTGPIPPELGSLSQLINLILFGNELSGMIPAELGNLSSLTIMNLTGNQLTGSIPAELVNLNNLTFLCLGFNQLTGTIPPELGNLSDLGSLLLPSNQLTGLIPLPVAQLGGVIEQSFALSCRFEFNPGLFMPDSQDYRAADLDGDGSICGVTLGLPASQLLVGTWEATSYLVGGADLIAQGMTLTASFTHSGAYVLETTGDLTDLCDDGETDCAAVGPYSVTETEITFDAGDPENEETFDYMISGSVLTVSGIDEGVPITVTFSRVDVELGIVGTWDATSYLVGGNDLIAQGMTLTASFTATGVYILIATGDLTDLCDDGETDCAQVGPYSVTETEITFDPGDPENEETFDYMISGSVLTVSGIDEGMPISVTFSRVE